MSTASHPVAPKGVLKKQGSNQQVTTTGRARSQSLHVVSKTFYSRTRRRLLSFAESKTEMIATIGVPTHRQLDAHPLVIFVGPEKIGGYSTRGKNGVDQHFVDDHSQLQAIRADRWPKASGSVMLGDDEQIHLDTGYPQKYIRGEPQKTVGEQPKFNFYLQWILAHREEFLDRLSQIDFVLSDSPFKVLGSGARPQRAKGYNFYFVVAKIGSVVFVTSQWNEEDLRRNRALKIRPQRDNNGGEPKSVADRNDYRRHSFVNAMRQPLTGDYGDHRDDGYVNNICHYEAVFHSRLGSLGLLYHHKVDCVDRERMGVRTAAEARPDDFITIRLSQWGGNYHREKVGLQCAPKARVGKPDRKMWNGMVHYHYSQWWTLGRLMGVPRLIVGFRNADGVVEKMELADTAMLPEAVAWLNPEEHWKPNNIMAFIYHVLRSVKPLIVDEFDKAQYTIEWIPGSKTNDDGEGMAPTIRVEKITPSGSYQILPKWFTDKMAPEIYARC